MAATKAVAAAQAVKKGAATKCRNVHYSVQFHRPKTLALPRNPIAPVHSVAPRVHSSQVSAIVRAVNTYKAKVLAETDNMLVFECAKRATKGSIKAAVEKFHGVRVVRVNTLNTARGVKKAYVRLAQDCEAKTFVM